MNGDKRRSVWGAQRLATITLLTATMTVFTVGILFNIGWEFGWLMLASALGSELLQSLRDLRNKYYLFDAPLFAAGMLLFTVFDPLFAIFTGSDFPAVQNGFHTGNLIGNLTGVVIAVFCLSFFLGRNLIKSSPIQTSSIIDPYTPMRVTSLPILLISTCISLFAFFANGGGFSLSNLIWTITARARGYVAFSTSGLGTENPIVALFGQCIPTAIILWLISITRGRPLWNGIVLVTATGLFTLYILLGGRSGVVFLILTLALFITVRRQLKLNLGRLLCLGIVALTVLAFQANFRDRGNIGQGFFEYSPFRGFALNREVAFIVETYGEREGFIRGQSVLSRIILPIPDTVILFITNPIPRKFWPEKPVDPSFGPFNEARTGKTGFGASSNITPTIPGRYYISYGFWGVIQIGFVFGFLWRWFNQKITNSAHLGSNHVLMSAMLNAVMFISLRDFTFGKFYPFFFLLFFIYLARFEFRIKKFKSNA